MEEELITFETAKLAKEKKFNESCRAGYLESGKLLDINAKWQNIECSGYAAPTQSLLQKWLREKEELFVYVKPKGVLDKIVWMNNLEEREVQKDKDVLSHGVWRIYHKTYEQALEKGLQLALKLIINK